MDYLLFNSPLLSFLLPCDMLHLSLASKEMKEGTTKWLRGLTESPLFFQQQERQQQRQAWLGLLPQHRSVATMCLLEGSRCIFCRRPWYGKVIYYPAAHDICTRKRMVPDPSGPFCLPSISHLSAITHIMYRLQ